jgi:cystathionine gamma-synthase
MHFDSLCAHTGAEPDKTTGAVTAPIHFASTFQYAVTGELPTGFNYSRHDNPTRQQLEHHLAQLEGGAAAAAFASGSAAAHAMFASLRPGDHVITNNDVYIGVRHMLTDIFMPWGLDVTFTDLSDVANLKNNLKPTTKLVWTETPTNPQMRIVDIAAVVPLAHAAGARVAVDNTFATPVLQQPLRLGADFAMHSTTKYLGGHSDLIGGALVTAKADDWWERIKHIQHIAGAVPGVFDCWLVMRGIRSLVPRVQRHQANAQRVAAFLNTHPNVQGVLYPGLATHPGHAVAQKQMQGFGAIVSVLVKGGKQAAVNVVKRVKLFTCATSLGGTESLIEHRQSAEGPGSQTPDNLLRLSIGLEHPDDLIADLAQALG